MAKKKAYKDWQEEMIKWVKKLVNWQEENAGKDWVQSFGEADGPGSNVPPPPPPPPGH